MPNDNQPAKSYITAVLAEADVAKLLDALWKIAVLRQGCKPPKDGGNEIAWEATGIARAALENLENTMASNDAKSYIATVLARADGATKGPWYFCENGTTSFIGRPDPGDGDDVVCCRDTNDVHPGEAAVSIERFKRDGPFIAASRQDIETLAKIALRAIEALEEYDDASEFPSNRAAKALADINALAAKGSQ